MRTILVALLAAFAAVGQTTINGGRTILGPWDASGATTTKACKSGTAAPASCAVGECFFDTDATAGSNLFGCTSVNTWTALGGSGGGSSILAFSSTEDTIGSGATEYYGPGSGYPDSSTDIRYRSILIPMDCTIDRLYLKTNNAQSGTGSYVFTVQKNGVDTAVTLTIAAGGAGGVYSDLTHSVAFSAGDLFTVKAVNNATATSAQLLTMSVRVQ